MVENKAGDASEQHHTDSVPTAASTVNGEASKPGENGQSAENKQARRTPPESIDIDNSKPEDFDGQIPTDSAIPSVETIRSIEKYVVLDNHGKTHTFRSLYSGANRSRRVLVIFVRHFFCGMCQDFIRSLCEAISPESLLNLPVSTFITVIGCGDPALIDMYAHETNCPFPIYTDPTRSLFSALGMTKTLNSGTQPEYAKRSVVQNALSSLLLAVKHIPKGQGLKSGNMRQVGGEFLFEPLDLFTPPTTPYEGRKKPLLSQPGWESKEGGGEEKDQIIGEKYVEEHSHSDGEEKRVTWCHRMKTTRDHSELEELKEVLGLEQDSDKHFERKGTGLTMASRMSQLSASLATAAS